MSFFSLSKKILQDTYLHDPVLRRSATWGCGHPDVTRIFFGPTGPGASANCCVRDATQLLYTKQGLFVSVFMPFTPVTSKWHLFLQVSNSTMVFFRQTLWNPVPPACNVAAKKPHMVSNSPSHCWRVVLQEELGITYAGFQTSAVWISFRNT